MNNSEDQTYHDENGAEEFEKGTPEDSSPDIFNDGLFTIKISDEMTLRNALRAGLVEAQGKDTDKIPMFVSWPPWLEDGVVCLFAKDLHAVLRKVIRDTAEAVRKDVGADVPTADLDKSSKPLKPPVMKMPPAQKKKTAGKKVSAEKSIPDKQVVQKKEESVPESKQEEPKNDTFSDQDLADKLFSELRNELKNK